MLRDHGFPREFDVEAYEPVGCVRCGGMGYRGRIGLYEVMVMNEEIRSLALERSSPTDHSAPRGRARECAGCARTASTRSSTG